MEIEVKTKVKRKRAYPSDPNNKGGHPIYWTEEKIDKITDYFEEFAALPTSIFLIEFIVFLKKEKGIYLNRCHLPDFCSRNARFKEVYDYVQMSQECKLLKGGTLRKLDASMCKFILSANHGYTDKQVVQHEGNETVQIVNYGTTELKKWKQEHEKENNN